MHLYFQGTATRRTSWDWPRTATTSPAGQRTTASTCTTRACPSRSSASDSTPCGRCWTVPRAVPAPDITAATSSPERELPPQETPAAPLVTTLSSSRPSRGARTRPSLSLPTAKGPSRSLNWCETSPQNIGKDHSRQCLFRVSDYDKTCEHCQKTAMDKKIMKLMSGLWD